MSKPIRTLARLAKVRQDLAIARAKSISQELAQIQALQKQVSDFASEYGEMAVAAGQHGVSVSMLADTLAFRSKLLGGAKDQEVVSNRLGQQLQEANRRALAAKRKTEGLEKMLAKMRQAQAHKEQQAEWQAIEDRVGNTPAHHPQKGPGTKGA